MQTLRNDGRIHEDARGNDATHHNESGIECAEFLGEVRPAHRNIVMFFGFRFLGERTKYRSGQQYIVGAASPSRAVLVTVGADGTVLDRRRVELVDDALPALPFDTALCPLIGTDVANPLQVKRGRRREAIGVTVNRVELVSRCKEMERQTHVPRIDVVEWCEAVNGSERSG